MKAEPEWYSLNIETDKDLLPIHDDVRWNEIVNAMHERQKKITAIFQPHLYTRTRDFYQDFADSLSLLDEVILVDIYPAREAPIPGVTSRLIYDNLRPGIEKSMCKKEDILNILKDKNIEVLITLGAGDIDNYVPEIKKILERKND